MSNPTFSGLFCGAAPACASLRQPAPALPAGRPGGTWTADFEAPRHVPNPTKQDPKNQRVKFHLPLDTRSAAQISSIHAHGTSRTYPVDRQIGV